VILVLIKTITTTTYNLYFAPWCFKRQHWNMKSSIIKSLFAIYSTM